MRLLVMSDLHLEFDSRALHQAPEVSAERPPPAPSFDFYFRPALGRADVTVLAGDIHGGMAGLDWIRRNLAQPVVLVVGNHEAYGHELQRLLSDYRRKAADERNVHFLEQDAWVYEHRDGTRVRFIGTTLWTDFRLFGDVLTSMKTARDAIEDFQMIKIKSRFGSRPLTPADTAQFHRASVEFLRAQLEAPFDGPTVVVTHHAPSARSVAPKFQDDALTPAFASNLEALIDQYQPAVWVHGHMHDSFDYQIGRTRVVCNPRGYFPHELNPRFDAGFVVEI